MKTPLRGFVSCVPIRCDPQWPGLQVRTVEDRLAALGNPSFGTGKSARPCPGQAPPTAPIHHPIADALDATGCIHFMSMSVVWNGEPDDRPFLIVDITGDGSQAQILRALVAATWEILLPVFAAAQGVDSEKEMLGCLRRYARSAAALWFSIPLPGQTTGLAFQGTPGLAVQRILKDRQVERIAREAVLATPGPTPRDRLQAAKAALSAQGVDLPTREQPPPAQVAQGDAVSTLALYILGQPWALGGLAVSMGFFFFQIIRRDWAGLRFDLATLTWVWVSVALALLAVIVLVGGIVAWLALLLRQRETSDPFDDLDPIPETVEAILERENHCAQNHMVNVSTIKPGFLRLGITLPLALYIVGSSIGARLYKQGFLSDIGTIHCAQWVRLPGTNKLLFFSNYDGSWQSYLEDFITKANVGLTAIWSNTTNFPRTRWLFLDGATDGDRFKRWARRQQIPTPFWYSAYPDLTTSRIRTNALVRGGLESPVTESDPEQCNDWIDLFGSAPRPADAIETSEVQGIVLNTQRDLLDGACLLVRFPEGAPTSCAAWLREVAREVTFGRESPEESAVFFAVSAPGLQRIGLDGVIDPRPPQDGPFYSNFPSAFVEGMAHEARRRILGDIGANAPEHWQWGNETLPIHAALLIYATDDAALDTIRQRHRTLLADHGLALAGEIRMQTLPPRGGAIREPFGFVDGISQPAIRSVPSSKTPQDANLVEAGELILGYPDGREQFPSTPQIYAGYDPKHLLPRLPAAYPKSDDRRESVRDIGQNGSFLVIRQLEQDVAGFDAFLKTAAEKLPASYSGREEWLAAKLVGRWRNGAPLVRHPDNPPAIPDAEKPFLFGAEDPQGFACPMGAHIRRANPRDNFGPGDPNAIPLTNRHRLLRRGRTYVGGDNPTEPGKGILFMGLNADIERQFEFLQQTWIGSTSFNGLVNEADPITANGCESGRFTIPQASGPLQVEGLSQFVKAVGGGYFFLPGRRALRYLSEL